MSRISRMIFGSKKRSFVIGLVVGLVISLSWPLSEDLDGNERSSSKAGNAEFKCPLRGSRGSNKLSGDEVKVGEEDKPVDTMDNVDFEPQINLAQKPMSARKGTKNIIRPRYYSSELGIREKLFIGVMSQPDQIDTLATAFNKTSAHLVNKIKFFINADNVKSTFRLKNIVGFTDTRDALRPFHILKYIADNYLDDYDYFLITPDSSYLDSRSIKEKLSHVSISFDIYMGTPSGDSVLDSQSKETQVGSVCLLESGIILSSSVIRKIRSNLDWCVRNANSKFHSLNIGRCVKYSTKLEACQQTWQGISIQSFELINGQHGIYHDFSTLSRTPAFNQASVIYPVNSVDDFYRLHLYFSRVRRLPLFV